MAKKKRRSGGPTTIRRTKDGNYVAVNVYIHVRLLSELDAEAGSEDRSRRAQLERVLCKAYGIEPTELAKGA